MNAIARANVGVAACLAAMLAFAPVTFPQSAAGPSVARPKLILTITIDQFRGDLIERYDAAFTGGFRRLIDRGFRFTRATVDHAPTNSYPGHVSIATGAFPARHGIVDNSWVEALDGRLSMISGASDAKEKVVGFPEQPGVSPSRLMVTGIADWILQNDKNAEVVNISSNEYGSLLHAGRTRGHTYWFSPAAGRYVTSTYYRPDYPAWLENFNQETMPKFLGRKAWESEVPERYKGLALADKTPYEFDNVNIAFPHRFDSEVPKQRAADPEALADWFYFTPFTDEAAIELTKVAVSELKLGQRNSTDYLSLTLGSTDSIGHRFGPLSLEQLDNLLRLDRHLGEFFKHLDKAVGAKNYIVAVTGDHGSSDIPEHGTATGRKGHRVTVEDMEGLLKEVGDHAAASAGATPEKMREDAIAIAEKYSFVGDVIANDELAKPSEDLFLRLYRNSYFPGRTPIYPIVSSQNRPLVIYGLRVRLAENAVPHFAPSNHGTPYFYDRHVGMIFMGGAIRPGKSVAAARTVDVAPTLAALGNIRVPIEIDGRSLQLDRR